MSHHHHQHDEPGEPNSKEQLIKVLAQSIETLAREVHGLLANARHINERIIMNQQDLIAAATALSTASDAVSVKLDALITAVDNAIAALANTDLTPAGDAAVAALQASAVTAATAGDKVDAEVAKLDAVLPTPAPAAPAV
jgi:DNA uptake protein ComE-like DNA-binding protein